MSENETPPSVQPGHPDFQMLFDTRVNMWAAWIPTWNGKHTSYNPSGRRFKSKELRLMGQQEGFDQMGVSGFPPATTADELLQRAKDVAELGKRLR